MVRKTVTMVDIDHILLESDGPVKYSGQIGTPRMIKDVLKVISDMKKVNLLEMENRIERNTREIFPKLFN